MAFTPDFKPGKSGLEKILGQLEAAVMEEIWKKGPSTVREIFEILVSRREIAYTTVMTIMGRLVDKGLLKKDKESGAHVYEATCSRCDFLAQVIGQVVNGLLDDFAEPALDHFLARLAREDQDCLQTLEKLLQERNGQTTRD